MSIAFIDAATATPTTSISANRLRANQKSKLENQKSVPSPRLAANRANSKKSTGPRTPQGKQKSSKNALKHGLSCKSASNNSIALLPSECKASFLTFKDEVLDDLRPNSPCELILAERVANTLWTLRRFPGATANLLQDKDQSELPSPELLARFFRDHDDRANPLSRLQRYESRLHRSLHKDLDQFRKLQSHRSKNPRPRTDNPHKQIPPAPDFIDTLNAAFDRNEANQTQSQNSVTSAPTTTTIQNSQTIDNEIVQNEPILPQLPAPSAPRPPVDDHNSPQNCNLHPKFETPITPWYDPAPMPLRAKPKRADNRRRTVVVRSKPHRKVVSRRSEKSEKPTRPLTHKGEHKPGSNGNGSNGHANGHSHNGFHKALRSLSTLTDHERLRIVRYNSQNFDLERMRTLLRRLGNPHQQFKSVHIAGTKGKGSTCSMTANMLQACGMKVGLYTSPHLVDIRERIQINGEMIPHADFARLVRLVEPMLARIKPTPSFFDVITAIAFKYFAEQEVEIAIVETGLGGRLDSTNVLTPEVTAITSISKDHMQQLGHTLPKIAEEKAGIFKKGIPAISVSQDPAVEDVLRRHAEKAGAPFDITGKTIEFSYRFESSRLQGPHNRICLTTPNSKFEHLAVPLLGEHQAINCGLALSIIDKLRAKGHQLPDARLLEGLSKTNTPGRMEMVCPTPRILVDGAHNAASVDAMMRAIGQHIPYDSMVVIFGCCADKDIPGMLERITSGADKVIFTNVDSVRTADPEELAARYIELYGKMAQVAPTLSEAMDIALRAVTKEDLICITGSFYLVGEAKKLYGTTPPKLSLT